MVIGAEEINGTWLNAMKLNGSEKRSIDEVSINLDMSDWVQEVLNFYIDQVAKITVVKKLVVKGKIVDFAIPIPDQIQPASNPEKIGFKLTHLLKEFKVSATPATNNSSGFTFIRTKDVTLKCLCQENPLYARQALFGMALRELLDEEIAKQNGNMVAITLTHEKLGHVINIDGDKLEIILGKA